MDSAKRFKVLIVEDEPDIGELLQCVLNMQGLDATLVKDGVEALESISGLNPDVLITDIAMPRKDGLTLIKEIRKREAANKECHALPIIVMSAGDEAALPSTSEIGAAFGLRKPFDDFVKLVERIKNLLNVSVGADSFNLARSINQAIA